MSYAMKRQGFGLFLPFWAMGPATDQGTYCTGGEMATKANGDLSNECCGTSTWSNATYAAIKGYASWRYWNESRVRKAMNLLFDPPFEGSDFPSGLHELAAQSGAKEPNVLVARGRDAAVNFWMMLPPSHWSSRAKGIQSDCQEDGWYSTHEWKRPWTSDQIAAFERASGIRVNALERTAFTAGAASISERVNAWLARAWAVVDSVPGSSAGSNVRTMPTLSQLAEYAGGTIQPSAWLAEFIDVFATDLSGLNFGPTRKPVRKNSRGDLVEETRPSRTSPTRPERVFAEPAPPPEDVPGASKVSGAVIAAGAVAALGLAWWGTRRAARGR